MAAKNTYDVVLEKVGNQQLKTTKALCSALGLGLAAAKGLVDKAPTTVAKGLDKDKALALKKELEDLGNTVSIPGIETKTEAPATKKTTTTKKQTTKKSAPSPSKVATPSNDDFDAIFGGDTAQKTTKTTKAKSAPKATTQKATAASDEAFDEIFGDSTPKVETKSKAKTSTPKVVDKQAIVGEYFAELAQLHQGIKETGTYSGDGDMKPEIALAVYGDIDAVFSSFKRETLSGYMRIARSELEKQYKKLSKKIEKMKKASRIEKMIKCFSDDDQKVPCISYELALRCLRNNRPGSYLNYLYTAAAGGDPRAITYEQRYYSTNTNDANPFSWTFDIKFNGEFNFYQMFYYAVRGIGFDHSPYYPDSSIAIPASTYDEVNVNVEKQRAKSLGELLKTLSYFVLPENIGTAEYKEHFGDFMPSELQIKIARHWFFIEDDRLIMSEETKKLRDEMKEKITNAVCNTPADAANTAKKTASDVKTTTAETPSELESKTAPQIISLDLGDGDSYEGEMKDGKYHGMGTYRWGNGNVYTGEYVNGVRQGKGKFVFASGSSYEGEWKNGKYHGKGKWTNADGSYYTGVWENDDIIDSTKIEYPAPSYASESVKPAAGAKIERVEYDNGSYEGEIVDGLRHGKGKYTWSNGSEYEGNWVNGKRCGFGVYRSYSKNEENGTTYLSYIYEGEWKDSKQHGHGVAKGYKVFPRFGHVFMNWSYDGPWVDDKKHGRGVYREWDGNALSDHWKVYEGEWIDDKRHGLFVWRPEPAAKDLKYIDYYDHGKEVVGYIDYDPSIKTLEDARRAKETEREENQRVMDERRARKAAQSSSSSDTSSDSDNEAVWEEFEYVEHLIEKLKNPELFDDPEDRWIANAYQYFEVFMSDVATNYSDADFATASEIFANILDLDVNGLQDYLTDKLGYIGDHYYVDYIETCLNYACLHVTKNALIPFANLCYFRTKEIGINYMDLYVKAYSRHYVAKGEDILWFERYACNGDGFVSLSDEDDSRGNEIGYGDSLRQMLTNGYRMGSDCRLYLPMKSLSEASPSVGETYRMYQILSRVYDVGEWSDYSPYDHGSLAMDTYTAWMENEDEHTFLFRNDGVTKRTGSRKGDYSKRRVTLIPLRNYISDAMLANEQVRKSVPLSERLLYQRKLNEMVEEAMEYVRKGCIGAAFEEFQDAFDGGYEPKKLAEICYDVVRDVLQKNEVHWEFDDPYVEIMKIVAVCDPESYAYFMSSIARESFGNYNHKYIYEVLTGEEYPG